MQNLQYITCIFIKKYNLECSVQERILDLVSEIGEISKEYLEATEYGKKGFQPSENWDKELGDALFSLICIANSTGVDLEQVLVNALSKYEARIKSKGDAGSKPK